MSSAIFQKRPYVSLGFLKVNVWQTDGGSRPINKSRSMSTVRCRSDWFLSQPELSFRCLSLPLRKHGRWILWAYSHTQTQMCVFPTDGREGHITHALTFLHARYSTTSTQHAQWTSASLKFFRSVPVRSLCNSIMVNFFVIWIAVIFVSEIIIRHSRVCCLRLKAILHQGRTGRQKVALDFFGRSGPQNPAHNTTTHWITYH